MFNYLNHLLLTKLSLYASILVSYLSCLVKALPLINNEVNQSEDIRKLDEYMIKLIGS